MKFKHFLIIGLAGIILVTVFILSLPQQANDYDYHYEEITNFEECAQAGYPVMESYPRQCHVPEGKTFVEELTEEEKRNLEPPIEKTCEDFCGDGTCQEIVCLAIGCPCAETAKTCPQDCQE